MKAPHPFPARMAPDLALRSVARLKEGPVLDPMCGSGMVLKAAMSEGLEALGFDVDPLAVLMSSVWTTEIDEDLEDRARSIVGKAQHSGSAYLPWMDSDPETLQFVDFWFGTAQAVELRRLASVLWAMPSDGVTNALRLAMSRTIVTKTRGASLASDVSHSRPHRTKSDNDYDVYAGFIAAAKSIEKALSSSRSRGQGFVQRGDARSLDLIEDRSIGMVVTSPPYLNAIDYLRGHRLALVWLGHTVSSLRHIRSNSIGAERRLSSPTTAAGHAAMRSELELDRFTPRLQGMLERYVLDLYLMSGEIMRVLRPGGEAILVVGNSTIRGEFVDNALFATSAAIHNGMVLTDRSERELPENKRYLPPPKGPLAGHLSKRMRTEVVVRLQKPVN